MKLDYYAETADFYAGLDRFGRIKRQLWKDYTSDANRDHYTYGYDYNSNRTSRNNLLDAGRDTVDLPPEAWMKAVLDAIPVRQRADLSRKGLTATKVVDRLSR